jgi:pimeloyl-ACP methyl ester carboxylesterase
MLPFAMKAKYAQLTAVLQLIVKGDPQGLKFLDRLDLEQGETATAGGSLPGEATFCQVFADRSAFLELRRSPPSATYCDNRAVAKSFLKLCHPYFSRKQLLDVERDLHRIKAPTLVFAGQWDPVIEWQATLRVALGLPNATFVLIDGGHTPVSAGGTCFADAVDAFVSEKRMKLDCFVSHWP